MEPRGGGQCTDDGVVSTEGMQGGGIVTESASVERQGSEADEER